MSHSAFTCNCIIVHLSILSTFTFVRLFIYIRSRALHKHICTYTYIEAEIVVHISPCKFNWIFTYTHIHVRFRSYPNCISLFTAIIQNWIMSLIFIRTSDLSVNLCLLSIHTILHPYQHTCISAATAILHEINYMDQLHFYIKVSI